MSVGGTVIAVIVKRDRVWINTRRGAYLGDTGRWVKAERTTCAIYVKRSPASECVEVGDKVWWQGRWAYWTPRAGGPSERRLERIGFSGVGEPESKEESDG